MNMPSFAAALLLVSTASAAVLSDAPFQVGPPVVSGVEFAPRFEPACADVVFQPEDAPVSKPVALTSEEWLTDCDDSGSSGENCWERPGRGESMTAQLTLAGRGPLLPWESDVFRVCLTGPTLHTESVSTAYDYRVANDGALDGRVLLACGAKRALPPDPRGVQAALTPGLALAFYDRWAAYYPGGEIVLKIALKKERGFWPDETVVEKEITLPAAENYAVELGGAAGGPGGVFYAKYSIKRLGGTVSTEDETPVLETEKVSYEPRQYGLAPE